jgi:hypothetical protein
VQYNYLLIQNSEVPRHNSSNKIVRHCIVGTIQFIFTIVPVLHPVPFHTDGNSGTIFCLLCLFRQSLKAECHNWVVRTPASYSGGSRFNTWPRDKISQLWLQWFSLATPGKCQESTLRWASFTSTYFPINNMQVIPSSDTA